MTDINDTIREREETHGSFYENSWIAQKLKDVVRLEKPTWYALSPMQREAIEMILHKIARIRCGMSNHADHWHDIAGYATLVEQHINKEADNGNGNEAEKKSY